MRKIVTAFDHAGVDLHDIVIKTIKECGLDVIDVGTDSSGSVDFPDYAFSASQKILDKEADKGIFVCGSGIGMCLAANKIKGIYAAVCHDWYSAHQAVEHADINVMCLGSRVIGPELAHDLIVAFLSSEFNSKPNQIRRIKKVRQIEDGTFELKNNSMRLFESGQSVWLDNIRRGLIKNGKLAKDIERGIIRGVTSNPSIFRKAITNSQDYENALIPMALANVDEKYIFTQLTVEDIRNAADLFRDLYISSQGNDGFVSLEVSPLYAHDPEETLVQAKSVWKAVNRPNLMIKIPVTNEILPVITELTAAGINLNLTLIFSPEQYEQAAEAYIAGLRQRIEKGETIDKIRSVASIFVSRVDTKIDSMLAETGVSTRSLQGKAAIRNAQKIYNRSLMIFNDENFGNIRERGGNAQRVLWASTSVKNKLFKQTYYVDALVGENTVNTVPPSTLDALLKSCETKPSLPVPEDEIEAFFVSLQNAGINIDAVYAQLEDEGIAAFMTDYNATLDLIRLRCEGIRKNMGQLQNVIEESFQKFDRESVMRRIFSKDPTVWTFNTQSYPEIRSRLGWLDTYKTTESVITDYIALRNELKKEGVSQILLIGTGGTSIVPEVIANIFDSETDIKITVIDSTDPVEIAEVRKGYDPKSTLFIVSSKSGNAIEIHALMDYFFAQTKETFKDKAGSRFIAITDSGSALEKIASDLGFRHIFHTDSSVGGRFSALTAYGIFPAILMGLDHQIISQKVTEMMKNCSPSLPAHRNEGAALGTFIGTAAIYGKDKLTIIADPAFSSFGSWLELIIAESTGKEGKGIVPIDLEPELEDKSYANDRFFVYINHDNTYRDRVQKLQEQGYPVYEIAVDDEYDLFAEFYRWEIAVSVACSILYVNPFDQPDVLGGKICTSAKINEIHENGVLKEPEPVWEDEQTEVSTREELGDLSQCRNYNEIITRFISKAKSGKDYIAVIAFLPTNEESTIWLQQLRRTILQCTKCATMIGFGPRFLHSTDQLFKGGPNNGFFIQVVTDHSDDILISNEYMSFKKLEQAQALENFESLSEKGRHVIRIRFKKGFPV